MKNTNILITGSNGFIGRNLKKSLLLSKDITIYEFNRNDKIDKIEKIIDEIDFIFHFAGEVRPSSSDESFNKSHGVLTQRIIKTIEDKNLKIPILLTSSKHASNPVNMYGESKKQTEDLIIEYSKRNNISIMIYRLSHVFGQGCKPNYNSVISTWIYNSINNMDIKIYDRDIKMRYLYVNDIVKDFINKLDTYDLKKYFYEIDEFYDTTLGEVVDYLEEFKKNSKIEFYNLDKSTFKSKLLDVYISYLTNK